MKFISNLIDLDIKDVSIAGGKGANLGELLKIGMPVPPGFVILVSAFERLMEKKSEITKNLILKSEVPKDIEKEIFNNFKRLKTKYVAVRSSATAEDSEVDSWAGELETYLNTTKKNLIKNVKKCWTSLFTPRVISYRVKRGLGKEKMSMAVVVQKMIQSEVSGVCFTVHPVIRNRSYMIIEAVQGLGEKLVQGKITPDSYVIKKDDLKILDINIPPKEKQKLSEKQIKKLAKLCIKIEKHYKTPQDIEWAFSKNKFHILQSRPITTI